MNMGMSMGFQLQIVQVLECKICRQGLHEEKRRNDMITAALFGNAAYAMCCGCQQEVKDHKDRNYRARFRRMRKKQKDGQQKHAELGS